MGMPIGTLNNLVATIQAQLAARVPAGAAAPTAAATGAAGKAQGRPPASTQARARQREAGRYARENLAGLIELRIGQIARDDPNRGRKAFRGFLEAVLLSQLGEALVNDPRFFQLVDDVQNALETDAATSALVADAITQLLQPGP